MSVRVSVSKWGDIAFCSMFSINPAGSRCISSGASLRESDSADGPDRDSNTALLASKDRGVQNLIQGAHDLIANMSCIIISQLYVKHSNITPQRQTLISANRVF